LPDSDEEDYEAFYQQEDQQSDNTSDGSEAGGPTDEDGDDEDGDGDSYVDDGNDPEDDPGDVDADVEIDGQDDAPNFGLNHPRLNVVCRMLQNITIREVIVMILTLSVRHRTTYALIEDIMKVVNVILGRKYLPESKHSLWKLLGKDRAGITKYYYCVNCQDKIENVEDLPPEFNCIQCNCLNKKRNLPYFVSTNLKKQFRYAFETPGFAENLNYREERVKVNQENIEDIFDGTRYRNLSRAGNVLSNPNNFSYGLNNDGFRITRTSNAEAQPIYVKLNELPPSVRQKHIFLAGIWIDRSPPNMNCMLETFVEQANDLSTNGLRWRRNGEYVNSLFIDLYCTADAKAKALLLNLNEPVGFHSCLFCDIVGVQAGGVKFPMWPYENMPEPAPRTHETIINDMLAAGANMVNGFRGVSALAELDFFNLKESFSCDDLHPIYVGVVKDYFESLFLPDGDYYIGPNNIAILNQRWLRVKFPTCLARKPRKISTYKRWRGSEFRNFLLYGLPCLTGLVQDEIYDNLKRLANASFTLSKQSISDDDLTQAEEDLSVFLFEFQDLFGVEKMKFNVHVLTHITDIVRTLGNLFVHSTYNFESWNHRLKTYVTSSWGTCDQVVFRLLLVTFVSCARFDNRIADRVRLSVESILLSTRLDTALHVGEVYLLGKENRRPVTAEEVELLRTHGVILDEQIVLEYKRAYCNNFEWRSRQYTREGRCDNSNVQTFDGAFANIVNILVVRVNGEQVCGLVCEMYHLLNPVPLLHYMYTIPVHDRNLIWLWPSDVSSLVVKNVVQQCTFLAPIANNVEID